MTPEEWPSLQPRGMEAFVVGVGHDAASAQDDNIDR